MDEKKKNRIINISITGVIAILKKWLTWRKEKKG